MSDIFILGRGHAALTAAWLLCEKGLRPIVCGAPAGVPRRLALNASTVELVETLFAVRLAKGEAARWMERRTLVGWNSGQDNSIDWPSLSIDAHSLVDEIEQRLLQRFGDQVTFTADAPAAGPGLVIDTIGPHHSQYSRPVGRVTLGRRMATACTLRTERPGNEVLVERTAASWLFLLPAAKECWTLYVVAADSDRKPDDVVVEAIESSSLRCRIADRTQAEAWHPVAPTLHYPLATPHWIRAGEAAFTFDPLCGDGVGYAVRSAILAATVAADMLRQELRGIDYYQFRLHRAFRAHLQACCQYYALWDTPDWQREVASMETGIAFLDQTRPGSFDAAAVADHWSWDQGRADAVASDRIPSGPEPTG